MITLFDKKENCCGCTACKSVCPNQAITMQSDKEGFLYPVIDESLCIKCGLCKEVCAFQIGYDTSNNLKPPEVYALKHKSDDVRMNSSSGGAFTAISDFILSERGVIYGASYDEDLHVIHQRAETKQGRDKFRGSKYVQSDLKDVFPKIREDLINGKSVLFTGTPCQTAGLSMYLKKKNTENNQLISCDLICHGTPSPLIFTDYISYCQKKNKRKVIDHRFRSKAKGWGHTEETIYESGEHDCISVLSQMHKELFYSNLCLRPSCHYCKYTNTARPADITIGDYWGIESCLPEFKDRLGVSVIIINTAKGKSAFLHFQGDVNYIASTIEDCAARQRNLRNSTPQNPRRDEFWMDYFQHGFDYVIKKYTGYGLKKKSKTN